MGEERVKSFVNSYQLELIFGQWLITFLFFFAMLSMSVTMNYRIEDLMINASSLKDEIISTMQTIYPKPF